LEFFVHLRKGTTPRRLHADLDGLKDDELGRGGFTGRTANMYRRHDPTAYRSSGPLRPVDVLAGELKPSDASDPAGTPLLLFSNPDCRVSLSRRADEMPFFVRHVDGDLLCFVHRRRARSAGTSRSTPRRPPCPTPRRSTTTAAPSTRCG
jgi:homogentisate 1,2-dioxygenase